MHPQTAQLAAREGPAEGQRLVVSTFEGGNYTSTGGCPMRYAGRRRTRPEVPPARHQPSAIEPPAACRHFDWLDFACGYLSGGLSVAVALLLVAMIGGC